MAKILIGRGDTDLDYPICRPSLDLDFTQEVLDPRITFSRGSIGTRVNRNCLIETISANQPRFDYDPVTGECKGLLIEEQRTNLITSSNSFGAGDANYGITASATTSPDGSVNASLIYEKNTNNYKILTLGVTTVIGTTYCGSIFVKYAGTKIYARIKLGTTNGITINLITGAFVSGAGSYGIIPYPNGWYRIYSTWTATSTSESLQVFLQNYNNTSSLFQGDGSSGYYIYGAQLEAGAFPTSYIPTTASTVTRTADLASITGTNFSSWYNSSEGTMFASYQQNSNASGSNFGVFSLTASTSNSNNLIDFFVGSGVSPVFRIAYNGLTSQVYEFGGTSTANIRNKGSFSFTTNKFTKCFNGTFYSTSLSKPITSGIILPTVDRLVLGQYWAGITQLNGTISRLTYYPRRLKDFQLSLLTQ